MIFSSHLWATSASGLTRIQSKYQDIYSSIQIGVWTTSTESLTPNDSGIIRFFPTHMSRLTIPKHSKTCNGDGGSDIIELYQWPQDPQGIQTRIREELRPPSERRQDMLDALVKEFEAEN